MATKYDLPNSSSSSSNYTAEMTEYERLYKLKPRTQTGNVSYASATSGIAYSTATYGGGIYANQGEQGMLLVLKVVLTDYLLVASDFNNVETAIASKAQFKRGNDTFASGGTTKVVIDSFITADTQVIVSPTQEKIGSWSVTSTTGSFTITSDSTETSNVTFDWGATK